MQRILRTVTVGEDFPMKVGDRIRVRDGNHVLSYHVISGRAKVPGVWDAEVTIRDQEDQTRRGTREPRKFFRQTRPWFRSDWEFVQEKGD